MASRQPGGVIIGGLSESGDSHHCTCVMTSDRVQAAHPGGLSWGIPQCSLDRYQRTSPGVPREDGEGGKRAFLIDSRGSLLCYLCYL